MNNLDIKDIGAIMKKSNKENVTKLDAPISDAEDNFGVYTGLL